MRGLPTEIPAFVAGTLPEARALLVGDHTRECVACRRALMEARGGTAPIAPRSRADIPGSLVPHCPAWRLLPFS